jgi:hypothetical protein
MMGAGAIIYEIRVSGRLDDAWQEMFEGLSMCIDGGNTLLVLNNDDPALLHGVLAQLGQRNLTLLSVRRYEGASGG